MMLPLLFGLLYLLLSMRIMVDVRVELGDARKGICIALRIYGFRLYLDMPVRLHVNRSKAKGQVQKAKQFWPLIKAVIRTICWGQTDAYLHLGMQDAALLAMVSGALNAFGAALQAIAGQRFPFRMKTRTAFQTSGFELSARCIFSLVPGDIIFAVAKAAVKKTQREGFSWLSIPLKA